MVLNEGRGEEEKGRKEKGRGGVRGRDEVRNQ